MSVNINPSSPDTQPAINESTQATETQILGQEIKKDDSTTAADEHENSSSSEVQSAHETHQRTTLDANKNVDYPTTPEFERTADESTKSVTTTIIDAISISPEAQPIERSTTTPTNNDPNMSSWEIVQVVEPPAQMFTTTPMNVQSAHEPHQTTIPLDSNEADNISTPEFESTESVITHTPTTNHPPEIQQVVEPPTQTSTTTPTTNHPNISSREIQQVEEPPTQMPTTNSIPTIGSAPDPDPEQERKHLVNLIEQELNFVTNICPKLGKHQDHIQKEATNIKSMFEKLRIEPCELKELKDTKKIVTKLKLQIPAKYRTYDENDQQKNKQSNVRVISSKFLKNMPHMHNKLFNQSPFCKTVQQRYDTLSRELKLCLLCFSVFPENAIISRRLMVYWWIGEGLVPSDDEEYANNLFKQLMDYDFIEPVSKRHGCNAATCKMHPMVRAALVMIADKVKFFDFDEYGNPKDFGKFDEIESPEDVPEIYPLGDPREFFDFFDEKRDATFETIQFVDSKGNPIQFAALPLDPTLDLVDRDGKTIDISKKHYFYMKKKITTKSYKVCLMGSGLSKGIVWEKLHMLFNVKDDILEFKPEWFLRMKNVNVVFLGRWQSSAAHHIEVEEFKFEESLEHMNHVRFFSLQGVSRISELPKSISNLENLLILDLRACHNLEVIPKTIGSLKYLTHLDMSDCYLLEHMPKEISSLKSLQVLKGFVIVESSGRHTCTLHDLKKLEDLRKLSMYTHMKDFPQESHLEALQKFETLRKLTILWGSHESSKTTKKKPIKTEKPNQKEKLATKVMKLIPRKEWVKGSMRRMNAFNNSTLGSRLEKLDLKCYPKSVTPNWLTPGSLKGLKKLYIRGGHFSDLGQYQDIVDSDDSPIPPMDMWNVEVLRLKYLDKIKMDWRELQNLFPKMTSLEKVKCPRLTLFPCNERGVWIKKTTT